LSEKFDEDAPGGPRVAYLSSAHGVLVDFEQLFYDVSHAEEIELLTAVLLY
jgi:hypothetical protein